MEVTKANSPMFRLLISVVIILAAAAVLLGPYVGPYTGEGSRRWLSVNLQTAGTPTQATEEGSTGTAVAPTAAVAQPSLELPETAAASATAVPAGGNSTRGATAHDLPATTKELLQRLGPFSIKSLSDIMTARQHPQPPEACETAKYLLLDDIATVSGLGFSMLQIAPLALQALVSGRIFVHTSSVVQGATWSWCQEDTHSVDCYFKPWSSCIPYLRSLNLTLQDIEAAPRWSRADPHMTAQRNASIVAWSERQTASGAAGNDRSDAFYHTQPLFQASPTFSQLWWYGQLLQHYFAPLPWLQAEAEDFLRQNGLQPWDRFFVANVRHGSKGAEQKVIQPEEFVQPIKDMQACLGTPHVFLVTETRRVAERMKQLGQQHGFHVFTVDYTYPGADIWNTKLHPNASQQGQPHQQQAAAAVAGGNNSSSSPTGRSGMAEVGYVSAKVLAITKHGSGFIGTLHSAWAKVSVAAMYAHHARPVPVHSLRPGWAIGHGYKGPDSPYWKFPDAKATAEAKSRPWPSGQLCMPS